MTWLIVTAAVGLFLVFGLPAIQTLMTTESTDDAFVEAHQTNVSPPISGIVAGVFIDRNDRVEPGALLVQIDRRPFEIALAQAEAADSEARARLKLARAAARAKLAEARGSWFRRETARERLRGLLAALRIEAAALRADQAAETLAEADQRRIANLVRQGSAAQAELDRRNDVLDVARRRVAQAAFTVIQTRAALGLEPDAADPSRTPNDLLINHSTVQAAVSDLAGALAALGVRVDPTTIAAAASFDALLRPAAAGADDAVDVVVERAPGVAAARAGVARARTAVAEARLRLGFTEVRSEIAGRVQDRSVHPGDHVAPGRTLLSIRPDQVWITANFKETQIDGLRIGHPVDVYVHAYPKHVFKGRVAGFSPGVEPTERAAASPMRGARRLPVQIELIEPNPTDTPLFAGLSAHPYVHVGAEPTGPGAGGRLRDFGGPRPTDLGAGPAGSHPSNRARCEVEFPSLAAAEDVRRAALPPRRFNPALPASANGEAAAAAARLDGPLRHDDAPGSAPP